MVILYEVKLWVLFHADSIQLFFLQNRDQSISQSFKNNNIISSLMLEYILLLLFY